MADEGTVKGAMSVSRSRTATRTRAVTSAAIMRASACAADELGPDGVWPLSESPCRRWRRPRTEVEPPQAVVVAEMRGGGRCDAPAVGRRGGGAVALPQRPGCPATESRSPGGGRAWVAALLSCVPGRVTWCRSFATWASRGRSRGSPNPQAVRSGDASGWRTVVTCSRDHDQLLHGHHVGPRGRDPPDPRLREPGRRAVGELGPPLGGDLRRSARC